MYVHKMNIHLDHVTNNALLVILIMSVEGRARIISIARDQPDLPLMGMHDALENRERGSFPYLPSSHD